MKCMFQTVATTDSRESGMEREDTKRQKEKVGGSQGNSGNDDEITKTVRIDS